MECLERVPMVSVNSENVDSVSPSLILAVKTATFIAIDLELSGLGNRKIFTTKSIEDRYKALAEVAKSRAIISIGISCFRVQIASNSENETRTINYLAQNYDIVALCSEEYTVEPTSLKFLVVHGFDFNNQYAKGIPYYRGNDQASSTPFLRRLFGEIVASQKPVVLHNGFVDLLFLYHGLYCTLPNSLTTFLADLSEMFPCGVYDTKYIAEFHAHFTASYLEYVFRKRQRSLNSMRGKKQLKIAIHFPDYMDVAPWIQYRNCQTLPAPIAVDTQVCPSYAGHGWCKLGKLCTKSHNVDDILNKEDVKKNADVKRKKKSKKNKQQETLEENMDQDAAEHSPLLKGDTKISTEPGEIRTSPGHRAGYDAFMTGFIFASFVNNPTIDPKEKMLLQTQEFANRIYLCGKDVPLLLMASSFSKFSQPHRDKLVTLRPVKAST